MMDAMNVRTGAKIIVRYMLEKAITHGSLEDSFFIRYEELAKELSLDNANYCRICCQYLDGMQYIKIIRNDDGARLVQLTAKGIDFLEIT